MLSKLCIMNTLLHFLLLFQFCRSLRNISLGDCILGKSNVIITVGWLWWRHQRAPLFSLASGPPTLNPPLPITTVFRRSRQNFYLLRAFEFGYNDFTYRTTITSLIVTLFVDPCRVFCSFLTTVARFLYSLKCKLGYVETPHKSFMTE